jgi:uncharacterized GH25 family protein
MHVADIQMSLEHRGVWTNAMAQVRIVDAAGNPVAGATVSGHWTDSATDTDAATADEAGVATIRSDRTRDKTGTFTWVVDDVGKEGWVYTPDGNAESSDSIDF